MVCLSLLTVQREEASLSDDRAIGYSPSDFSEIPSSAAFSESEWWLRMVRMSWLIDFTSSVMGFSFIALIRSVSVSFSSALFPPAGAAVAANSKQV